MSSLSTLFLLICSLLSLSSHFHVSEAQGGLSPNFYANSCPNVETIIRQHLTTVLRDDIGQAAAILRIHFHDCFVQGCEASVLLARTPTIPGEQAEIPNLTLRPEALATIDELGRLLQQECGLVVSCADILTIAARDSVFLSGGPDYAVPLGRRDGLNFAPAGATSALPSPFARTTELLENFANQSLNLIDLVALSGGHSIGIAHCPTFRPRLFPNLDPTMEATFGNNLRLTCPLPDTDNSTNLDLRTPNAFDNRYYVNLVNGQGLFTSDQDLFTDLRTRLVVGLFAASQDAFFGAFVNSMTRLGRIGVLTGNQGNIRQTCSVLNSAAGNSFLSSVVDQGERSSSVGF